VRVERRAQDAVDAEPGIPEAGVGVVHFALGPRNGATLIVRRRAVLLDRAVYSPEDRSREVGGAGSMLRYRLTQSDEPALKGLDCATLPLPPIGPAWLARLASRPVASGMASLRTV
jgi:hypothetical protein